MISRTFQTGVSTLVVGDGSTLAVKYGDVLIQSAIFRFGARTNARQTCSFYAEFPHQVCCLPTKYRLKRLNKDFEGHVNQWDMLTVYFSAYF